MKYILIALATMLLFACGEMKTRGDTTMHKPARCKTLLRYGVSVDHSQEFDVAECINSEGNRSVFFKRIYRSDWSERVMLEK